MSESREMARGSPVTASRFFPPSFLFMSSSSIYHKSNKNVPTKESINLDQKQPCVAGDIKSRAERIILVFLSEFLALNVESP